jgi:CheY-like chemotaxis protein
LLSSLVLLLIIYSPLNFTSMATDNLSSILVVDDEPSNFEVIETLLSIEETAADKLQPYQLHYAASGATAIDSLDLFQPDLILLDVMMPGMDGLEVCRRIKAMPRWQSVPIIMVTSLAAKQGKRKKNRSVTC